MTMNDTEVIIYAIVNTKTADAYVGCTNSLQKRISKHFRRLSKNKHGNKFLQQAYNRDGEDVFTVAILETCSADVARDREAEHVRVRGEGVYNVAYYRRPNV